MPLRYLKNVVTLQIHPEKCVSCGICLQVCPHQVLEMQEKITIRNLDACMECGACAANCPFSAIQVQAGVGCAAAVINSMISGGEPNCDCGSTKSGKKGCC